MTLFLWLKKWNIETTPLREKEHKEDFALAAAS
jgi:hypothetical protein